MNTNLLTRYNPFTSSRSQTQSPMARSNSSREIDALWQALGGAAADSSMPALKIDVVENENGFSVACDLPGCKREDIKVSIDCDTVTLSAERKTASDLKNGDLICSERSFGSETRNFRLDSEIDHEKSKASYADGVLHLELPKKHGAASARKSLEIH